jgi:hypothetical protein
MDYRERDCITDGHCRPKHRATKDRKRWCGGHEGREHQYEYRREFSLIPERRARQERLIRFAEEQVCTRCQKRDKTRHRCSRCGSEWPWFWALRRRGEKLPPHVVVYEKQTMKVRGGTRTYTVGVMVPVCPGCGVRDNTIRVASQA